MKINTLIRAVKAIKLFYPLLGLKSVDLTGSGWLSNHSLMALCKCEELTELNLNGCWRIGECFAYSALACRFGFRKLKKADLTDTKVTNSEVL